MTIRLTSPFFLKIIILFSVTQILGVYVALKLSEAVYQTGSGSGFSLTWRDFATFVIFIVIFSLLTKKFPKVAGYFYKVVFTLLILSMVQLVSSIWLGSIGSWIVAFAAVIIFWIVNNVLVQDLVMIVTLAGFGAVFGTFLQPMYAVILLVAFSIYDIIAVYVTQHMITLAQGMMKAGAIFGFVIPSSMKGFDSTMSEITSGGQFMILGSGDIALPLVLTVAVSLISLNQGWIIGIFSVLGLILMQLLFINQKIRRPMAALPPIAIMSVIGYLIINLF